jgi:hypothetical protein
MNGTEAWSKECALGIAEDHTITCFPLEVPESISNVYFVKLALTDSEGNTLSDNFYWQGREEGNVQALRRLGKANVKISATKESALKYAVTLENKGDVPALMIRLKVKDSATDDLVLPVWYSDNYFFLMPGESKTVEVSFEKIQGKPVFLADGLNIGIN